MDTESEYTETWDGIEGRAGRSFNHQQRKKMRDSGIIFDKLKGRPPKRCKVVYTYWSLYLRFMVKTGGKFAVFFILLYTNP